MTKLPRLNEWRGTTVGELLALEGRYQDDSLVRALAARLDRHEAKRLSHSERIVLAVDALVTEVVHGGFRQFLSNDSLVWAGDVAAALDEIDCPETAAIARSAVGALRIEGEVTPESVETAMADRSPRVNIALASCDESFRRCDEDPVAALLAFVREHKGEILVAKSAVTPTVRRPTARREPAARTRTDRRAARVPRRGATPEADGGATGGSEDSPE